jgi:cobalt-zinc-cadmium efflux system outer membrane protein
VAAARTFQSGLRPNPELAVEVEGIRLGDAPETTTRETGFGLNPDGSLSGSLARSRERPNGGMLSAMEYTLRLSQLIELGGKRAARIELGEQGEAVARWDYEVARYRVASEVVARFTDALVAQERARMAERLREIALRTVDAVVGQVAAGEAAPLAEKRVRAEAEALRIRARAARQEAAVARIRLAGLWGATQAEFDSVAGDLAVTPRVPRLEEVLAARTGHPLVARWQAELARRDAMKALEDARAVPDLTVSVGYRAERTPGSTRRSFTTGTGGNSWSFEEADSDWSHVLLLEASVPVPVFNRNQGAREAAALETEQAVHDSRAAIRRIDTAIAALHASAKAARARADAVRTRVIPRLEEVLTLMTEGYTRGKYALLDLLDAEKALADAQVDELEARIALYRAIAELESILGVPMQGLEQDATDKERSR